MMQNLSVGRVSLLAELKFIQDENTNNNSSYFNFTVYPPANNFNDIIINEIMHSPSSGEPEWIELYNIASKNINLNHWTISDNSSSVMIRDNIFINENDFLIIAKDSTIKNYFNVPSTILILNFPSLNNTGDAVVLKDSLGLITRQPLLFTCMGRNGRKIA